jgi:NAD+ kinase
MAEAEVWLGRHGIETVLVHGEEQPPNLGWTPDPEAARRALECDLLVTLGGDGTILAGARLVAGTRVPVLPLNLGGLGFLSAFEGDQMEEALAAALEGQLVLDPRSLVRARVEPAEGSRARNLGIALNDVVVKHSTPFRALRMDSWAGDEFLGRIIADGLVAATPSGSTAYSLSAGGPVIAPGLEALVVTPICPHTLAMRSLVLPPSVPLVVGVRSRDRSGATVSLDGIEAIPLGPADCVRIDLRPRAVRFLRRPDAGLPAALVGKLGWSGPARRT